jgi:hypothetical protein
MMPVIFVIASFCATSISYAPFFDDLFAILGVSTNDGRTRKLGY